MKQIFNISGHMEESNPGPSDNDRRIRVRARQSVLPSPAADPAGEPGVEPAHPRRTDEARRRVRVSDQRQGGHRPLRHPQRHR